MKSLDNRGWGYVTFIIFIALLLFALVICALLSAQFDKEFPRDNEDYLAPVEKTIQ